MNHKTDILPPSTPCQHEPGDWFDQHRRALTRRHCLNCTSRRVCADTAMQLRPPHGMWAGIWIDGDFTAKEHLFASQRFTPLPAAPQPDDDTTDNTDNIDTIAAARARPLPPDNRRRRVGRLPTTAPPPQVAALITARASAHCEIMAPACTYTQAAIFTRRRVSAPGVLASPADAVAACANCIELIEHTELPTALDLGYLVDARTATSGVAMWWRHHRWVYLDTRGHLQPCTPGVPVRTHA